MPEDGRVHDFPWIKTPHMNTTTLKVGSIVRYAHPAEGESEFRFVLKEDNGDRVLIELICDYRIKPLETVPIGEIAPT